MTQKANPIVAIADFLKAAQAVGQGSTLEVLGQVVDAPPASAPRLFWRRLERVRGTLDSAVGLVSGHPRYSPAIHLKWADAVRGLFALEQFHLPWGRRSAFIDGNFYFKLEVDRHLLDDGSVDLPVVLNSKECGLLERTIRESRDEVETSSFPGEFKERLISKIDSILELLGSYDFNSAPALPDAIGQALGEVLLVHMNLPARSPESAEVRTLSRLASVLLFSWNLHKGWDAVKALPESLDDVVDGVKALASGFFLGGG